MLLAAVAASLVATLGLGFLLLTPGALALGPGLVAQAATEGARGVSTPPTRVVSVPGRLGIRARSGRGIRPAEISALGSFEPERDAKLAAAIAAFGAPSAAAETLGGNGCRVRWGAIGLTTLFVNYGRRPAGLTACAPTQGGADNAVIAGPNAGVWRTARGLRVGDSVRRLRQLYPWAPRVGRSYWLVAGYRALSCECAYGAVRASVTAGRVRSFSIEIKRGGE